MNLRSSRAAHDAFVQRSVFVPLSATFTAVGAPHTGHAVGTSNVPTAFVTATTFGPKQVCTRAQVVTFLWTFKGKPEPTLEENPFTDVTAGKYYYKPVLWAVENHITGGVTPTNYGPKQLCTRAQVVTVLYKTFGS